MKPAGLSMLWVLMCVCVSSGEQMWLVFPDVSSSHSYLLFILKSGIFTHLNYASSFLLVCRGRFLARVSSAAAATAPFTPVEFGRLMGISRPPDSFGIKSHFSDVSILGWTRSKKKKKSTRINRGEPLQRESDEDTLTSVDWRLVLGCVVFSFHIPL